MSLKKQLVSGVIYTAIAKYLGIGITLLLSSILARILSPEDFGIVAISTVFITFFSIFSDLGIGPAIVQNKKLTDDDISSIFTFTIYLGVAISIIFFSLSWSIANYYDKDILATIFQLLTINIFFASCNLVPNALLLREKQFKYIAMRTIFLQSIGAILSITAALNGFGVYSLLINPIISSVGIFILSYIKNPIRISLNIDLSSIKAISSYSFYQFLFNFINYFSRNSDKLLIGRIFNMNQLGLYDISYKLMMMPLQNITYLITPVMHPIFSDLQNDLFRLELSYLKIIRILAYIGFPLTILLFFSSQELILIIFGDKWMDAIPIFRILSLSVGIQVILSSSGSIFQASNSTKMLFISGLISSFINVIGLFITIFVFDSLHIVAWGIVITFAINFIICFWIMFDKLFNSSIYIFLKKLISPIIISLMIGIILFLFQYYSAHMHLLLSLIAKTVITFVSLFTFLSIKGEYNLIEYLKKTIRRRLNIGVK